MKNSHNRFSELLGFILGSLFLFSSLSKAVAAKSFIDLLNEYQILFPQFISIFIIIIEGILGIVLICGILQRVVAIISAAFIITLTLGYTYGYYFHDISNCGCFGDFNFLDGPLWVYLRNLFLLGTSIYIFLFPSSKHPSSKNYILTLVLMVVVGTIIGYLAGYSSTLSTREGNKINDQRLSIKDSPLKNLVFTNPDSTYLVFIFSYSCPHCLNSIANLNQYQDLKVVDNVIGLVRKSDDKMDFNRWFSPSFQIIELPADEKLGVKALPTTYYIKNDSIINSFQGELPCAYIFSKYIESI